MPICDQQPRRRRVASESELRHVPQEIRSQAVRAVEIRKTAIATGSMLVAHDRTGIEARKGTVVDGARESVRRLELQPTGELSFQCRLQRVIGGLPVRLVESEKCGIY